MDARKRKTKPTSPPAAAASVLGSDDLLGEILLRLAIPTNLIRAAAVCRRWLRVASDVALLARFRTRYPRPLLGFYYASSGSTLCPKFWPAPGHHTPELASAVRRAASLADTFFPDLVSDIVDSRDGRLLVSLCGLGEYGQAVLSPLLSPPSSGDEAKQPMAVLREPARNLHVDDPGRSVFCRASKFLPERGRDGLHCLELVQMKRPREQQTVLQVHAFQDDGAWITRASVATKLLETRTVLKILYTGSRFYMTTKRDIVVLNTVSASVSFMDYPDEEIDHMYGGWLSKVDEDGDPGVYLVNVVDWHQLNIWLNRKVVSGGANMSGWLLVDSICLEKIFADLGMWHTLYRVTCAGDNAAFVLLEVEDGSLFYFDIRSTTVELVLEAPPWGTCRRSKKAWPFMMPWPPCFPALELKNKEGDNQEE